jgi:hypothetical protein
MFANIELAVYRQYYKNNKSKVNEEALNEVLVAATAVLDVSMSLKTEVRWSKWRWQLQGHAPWQALAVSLAIVHRRTWDSQSEKAWGAAVSTMDMLSSDTKEMPMARKIANIMTRIRNNRDELRMPPDVQEIGGYGTVGGLHGLSLDGQEFPLLPVAPPPPNNAINTADPAQASTWATGDGSFELDKDFFFVSDGDYMGDMDTDWQGWEYLMNDPAFHN